MSNKEVQWLLVGQLQQKLTESFSIIRKHLKEDYS